MIIDKGKTMKAKYALIPEKETCQIREEEIDPGSLKPNELLMRTEFSMVSAGTELAAFRAISPGVYKKGSWNAYPWRPGYGLVGEVLEAGSALSGYHPGSRVFCFGRHASLQKWPLDLEREEPFRSAFPVSMAVSSGRVAASRMGLVGITASQISGVQAGETVAVFGLGMVGNLAAQFYKEAGARVIGLDPIQKRCELAEKTGIRQVYSAPPEEQIAALMDATHGRGVDIAVDAVGHSRVIRSCVFSVREGGRVILLGSPRAPVEGNLTEIFRRVHLKCIQVMGAFEWRLPAYPEEGREGSIRENLELIWKWAASGRLNLMDLITHVIQPEGLEEAYFGLMNKKEEYLGVLIDWRE